MPVEGPVESTPLENDVGSPEQQTEWNTTET
jgi:hypothetical protein